MPILLVEEPKLDATSTMIPEKEDPYKLERKGISIAADLNRSFKPNSGLTAKYCRSRIWIRYDGDYPDRLKFVEREPLPIPLQHAGWEGKWEFKPVNLAGEPDLEWYMQLSFALDDPILNQLLESFS